MNNKKMQYSKIITFLTFMLFCGCIAKCFSIDISSAYDLSMYATIITTSGALCLTSVVWYLKNSQAEKVAKIKSGVYKTIADEEFNYNKNMLKLKHEYNYSDEDIFEIENGSSLDELRQDAMNSVISSIDNAMEEAVSSIEMQTL